MTNYATITDLANELANILGSDADNYDLVSVARDISHWENGKLVADFERTDFWLVVMSHEKLFEVCAVDNREDVDVTYFSERFHSYASARQYYERMKDYFEYGENDVLWLLESTDDGRSWVSVDGYDAADRN